MKTLTYYDIKALGPCYDPRQYIPAAYSGTLVDILKLKDPKPADRLWVVVRHTNMTDRQLHLYGLACARQTEKNSTDPRVKACNDIVEAYTNGMATREQLDSA